MIAAFREILLADSTVATAVGDRVYPQVKPANERRACIVLTLVSDDPDYHMEGASGFAPGTIQLDCWSPTYAAAAALADAAIAALDVFSGTSAGKPIGWIESGGRHDIAPDIDDGKQVPSEYGVSFDADYLRI